MTARHATRSRTAAVLAAAALATTMLTTSGAATGWTAQAATPVVAGQHAPDHLRPDDQHRRGNRHVAARIELFTAMRTLWHQHMEWTWSTVVTFATGSPALPATLDRLLANQQDIGDAVVPFYGAAAGDQLAALLTTHITLAVPVLEAARAGDQAALDAALDDWFANAEDIADFLAAANPRHWDRGELREMMRTHISQTTAYAAAVLGGDYEGAIALFDEAEAHMSDMADVLSAGIIAQFRKRF